jgi:hypothetical protein
MKSASPRRSSQIALLGLAFLLPLSAGCGGDGDSEQVSAGASAPTAPQGGEKSIEEFGSEAEGRGREELLNAFRGSLEAMAARDYGAACSYLADTVHRSLEQFVGGGSRAKGCEALLPKLLTPTAAAIAREQANGDVKKVRMEGDRGFVVFHAPGAKLYQLTMVREGGKWKAATVGGSVLIPSAATLGQ